MKGIKFYNLLFAFFILSCGVKKDTKTLGKKMVSVKYIDKAFNIDEAKETTSFFESLNSKRDTLIDSRTLIALEKFSKLMVNDTLGKPEYDYYFFKDTIRVNNPMASYIYIPKTRNKYASNLYLNGKRKYEESKMFKDYRTKTEVTVYKEKKKKILDLFCYEVKIVKTKQIGRTKSVKIYNIFLSDKIDIPLHHYDIINLTEPNEIRGLALEIEIRNESGSIEKHYVAKNYKVEALNSNLIDVRSIKKL